jgi:hypothetical protein
MVMLSNAEVAESGVADESVTFKVKVHLPAAVGVPEIVGGKASPVNGTTPPLLRVSPGGNDPEAKLQVGHTPVPPAD